MVDKQNENNGNADDAVGYGRPPRKHQFRKGQSGNPKGRPKGSKNFKTITLEVLTAPVQITHKGKRKTVSTAEAALLRLVQKGMDKDSRSLERVIQLCKEVLIENGTEDALSTADNLEVLKHFIARHESGAAGAFSTADELDEEDDAWLYK